MDDLLIILGLLFLFIGFPTSIVTTIIFAVKKKKVKIPAVCIPTTVIFSFIFIAVGASLYSETDEYKQSMNERQANLERQQEQVELKSSGAAESKVISENSTDMETEETQQQANISENEAKKISTGTYIVGEDIEIGKYDFYAYKGTGSLKIYKSYDDYINDQYEINSFMDFDILADDASVGLLNKDVYTNSVLNIRLLDGWCLVVDKGLEMECIESECMTDKIISVGIYIVGEDLEAGKYDFISVSGTGSVKIYNSYDEFLEDIYGINSFRNYDVKEKNASSGLLNEDIYAESISNVRLVEGQCIVIEKGLKLEYEAK